MPLELVHPLRSLFELAHQRLHAAGAQAQFLDQHEHFVAAADVARAGGGLFFGRRLAAREQGEIAALPFHQVLQAAAGCAACGPAPAPW